MGMGQDCAVTEIFIVPLFLIFLDPPLEWGGETDVRMIVDKISMITVTLHWYLIEGSFGRKFLQEKRNGSGKCYFGRQAVTEKHKKVELSLFSLYTAKVFREM